MTNFPTTLKELRKAKGLTQIELGQAIGKGNTAITSYESGRTEPSIEDLLKLSEVLECSIDELVRGSSFQYENKFHKNADGVDWKQVALGLIEVVKQLPGKFEAYLMTQRVYLDTLLGTPGLK